MLNTNFYFKTTIEEDDYLDNYMYTENSKDFKNIIEYRKSVRENIILDIYRRGKRR